MTEQPYRSLSLSMPAGSGASSAFGWVNLGVLQGRLSRLEPLDVGHASALFSVAAPSVFQGSRHQPEWTVEGFTRYVEQLRNEPNSNAMAIVLNETGHAVGRIRFNGIRPQDRKLGIGTWIGPAYQGTGVNPEVKYLMLQHAFEQLSPAAIRVEFAVCPTNHQSIRAIEKLGAVREGVLRKSWVGPSGVATDTVMYSIISDDWPSVRTRLEARIGWRLP